MIYCVLLNPTIDNIIEIPNFGAGSTYKVENVRYFPVGKAISVALTLRELGAEPFVVAFIGHNEVPIYNEFLTSNGIGSKIIYINGNTRRNTTIIDRTQGTSTHIRYPGFIVDKNRIIEMIEFLESKLKKDDVVILSGSIPDGVNIEDLNQIIRKIDSRGARFTVDTSGSPLKHLTEWRPWFIKANATEMGQILGRPLSESYELSKKPDKNVLKNMAADCRSLLSSGTEAVMLTLGDYGALYLDQEDCYYGHVSLAKADYTVGCGDAFLGGYVYSMESNIGSLDAFKLAIACGAANTQKLGAGILDKDGVHGLYGKVRINRIVLNGDKWGKLG